MGDPDEILVRQVARGIRARTNLRFAQARLQKLERADAVARAALIAIAELPEKDAKPYSAKEFEERAYNEALWACQEIARAALAGLDLP